VQADAIRNGSEGQTTPFEAFLPTPASLCATIEKDGRTLVTFFSNGIMKVPTDVDVPSDLPDDNQGQSVVDARIKAMQSLLNGTIHYFQSDRLQMTHQL